MRAGDRLDGRFEIERAAGAGGMGTVYRARDLTTGTVVAVKMLHAHETRERFERESRVLATLDHPGIVRYVAHGTHEQAPYLAMEWLEGADLDERLARGITMDDSITVIECVAQALAVAHMRGIVHRDIKPSNIFLVGDDVTRTKLLDFGIAVGGTAAKRQTQTGAIVGTPGYMAPEQARGAREIDARADLFSLGCVLFECLTGRPVFIGEQVMAILAKILLEDAPRASSLVTGIPAALDDLISRLLAKDPRRRPADAREVLVELAAIQSDASPVALSRRPALGTGEQRIASVIVVGRVDTTDGATLSLDEAKRVPESILLAAQPFDAHVEPLADGTVFIALLGRGSPPDQAARAASCALALRAVDAEVPIALVMGRSEIKDHIPVGEAIDRAAKLVRLPITEGIRINDLADAFLDGRFRRSSDASSVFLLGRSEADDARMLLGKPTPCVGREAELAMLQALAEQSFDEPVSRAIVVTAPPGIGKSRLRHELLGRVRARGIDVWIARGDPVGAHSAFGLAAQLVRTRAGALDGEPLALRREKLEACVARHVPAAHRHRVAVFLAEMIGAPYSDEDDVPLRAARRDAILMGDQIRRAWEDFIDAETAAHPLMIVLEDLQWGDLPTIALVDAVLRLFSERPLFVLALARPEVDDLFPGFWKERDAQRISLAPLTRKACEKLVRAALDGAAADVTARLIDLSAGNAFHLEELIRNVSERGADELPETVVAMVETRLESLDPEIRRVLRAASVFGQVFWSSGVAALVSAEVGGPLTELVRREIVTRRSEARFVGETEYVFRHALVREAAYAMLTESDRKLGHGLAAGWLESIGETDTMALAEHFERGGELPQAVLACSRAALEALEGNDLDAALARMARGVRCGARGEVLGELHRLAAQAHWWRGDHADAVRAGAEAVRWLPHGSDRWADALGELTLAHGAQGNAASMIACVESLLSAIRSNPSARCVRAAIRASIGVLHAGRYVESQSLLSTVASVAELSPDVTLRASLEHARAEQAIRNGDTGSYLALMTAALRSYQEAGDARTECIVRSNVGFAHLEIGETEAAEAALTLALATANRMGLPNASAGAKQNLALALSRLGRFEEAERMATESAETFKSIGNLRMAGISRIYLASILEDHVGPEKAEAEVRRGVQLVEANAPSLAYARGVLSRILRKQGKLTEALDCARDAVALLEELGGLQEGEGTIRLALAEALHACGANEQATEAIAHARERLLARAAGIADAGRRQSFLDTVPENTLTLRLAREWVSDVHDRRS